MKQNTGLIVFLVIILSVIIGGFYYFSKLVSQPKETAIKCNGEDDITISFLIDDKNLSVIMAGKKILPNTINIFNKTAIEAAWKKNNIGTKIFLDRIAGYLEVETTSDFVKWDKERLECSNVAIRF